MPSHYSHLKLQESFKVKYVCIESMRRTAHSVGAVTPRGAWDFQWGDIPAHVPDTTSIRQEAVTLSRDITIEMDNSSEPSTSLGLRASMTRPGPMPTIPEEGTTEHHGTEEEMSEGEDDPSSASSSSSSSENSTEEEAAEEDLLAETTEAERTILATGRAKIAQVHVVLVGDDGRSEHIACACGKRLRRPTAIMDNARHFPAFDRRPCPQCRQVWPPGLERFWH